MFLFAGMKLWDKGTKTAQLIEAFTVGKDRELDRELAVYDVLGSLAHIQMLESIGLLEQTEFLQLRAELIQIYSEVQEENFEIEPGIEDIHSQVELMLTRRLGDMGKKIHSGRSRNDQVLLDLKLYFLAEIREIAQLARSLFDQLQLLSERHKDILLPGYTHFQVAMPSSFGLWFGAYAESLVDDLVMLNAAYSIAHQNPLGSAAGYGSSFPLNRSLTTQLLGFETLSYNVVYAQMGRGKTEMILAAALASFSTTLNKLAADVCLYMSQNMGFISFPDALTTGSSIMPHKKNPDVFELIRARTNQLIALPGEIGQLIANLPSGYHRDLQQIKEAIIPAIDTLKSCLHISTYMLEHISVHDHIVDAPMYDYLFSVEVVNEKVRKGVPFREAYRQVAEDIQTGKFQPNREVYHTHEGSIGNLCTDEIRTKMEQVFKKFPFEHVEKAWKKLLAP